MSRRQHDERTRLVAMLSKSAWIMRFEAGSRDLPNHSIALLTHESMRQRIATFRVNATNTFSESNERRRRLLPFVDV